MSLRDQLEEVRSEYGRLTPAALVDAARPEDHPLHTRFEWDDAVAGERYRLDQAREIIRSYRIKYADTPTKPKTIRGYVSVRSEVEESTPAYLPTEEVMADPFLKALTLREMEREVNALWEKYAHFEEFAALLSSRLAAA